MPKPVANNNGKIPLNLLMVIDTLSNIDMHGTKWNASKENGAKNPRSQRPHHAGIVPTNALNQRVNFGTLPNHEGMNECLSVPKQHAQQTNSMLYNIHGILEAERGGSRLRRRGISR
jgi:hypothetical protein